MRHPLSDMMGENVAKIRDLVDANTVIGDPIHTPEGVTILPVSKIKVGYAGGGSDFATKNYPVSKPNTFGGGSGVGVTVTPVAFLIIKGENVRLIPVAEPASGSMERLVEMLPGLIDQLSSFVKKKETENQE